MLNYILSHLNFKKIFQYILGLLNFLLLLFGMWFWQEFRDDGIIRTLGLLMMVLSIYFYRKYLKKL